jgi:hypothetical protein
VALDHQGMLMRSLWARVPSDKPLTLDNKVIAMLIFLVGWQQAIMEPCTTSCFVRTVVVQQPFELPKWLSQGE